MPLVWPALTGVRWSIDHVAAACRRRVDNARWRWYRHGCGSSTGPAAFRVESPFAPREKGQRQRAVFGADRGAVLRQEEDPKRMAGIVGFGTYIPRYRLPREVIAKEWGQPSMGGEKAVASQVQGAEVGLAHNLGGPGAVGCVTILSN